MKLYRLLLKLYPARFREEYARQMEIEFADEYREAGSAWVRTRFWIRAIADLFVSIPVELAREAFQDLRHARRMYAKRKFVTTMAVAALAVAIGATTGVFSVISAMLLRELPFREPDRIVEIRGGKLGGFSTKTEFQQYRAEAREYLEDGASYTVNMMNVEHEGIPRRRRVAETTANFFAVMGVEPSIGRGFLPDEDEPVQNQVAILSHALWQQDFGANSALIGSKLTINGVPFTIVGIAPRLFEYPAKTDVWTATAFTLERLPKDSFFLQVVGRLKAELTIDQARTRFETIVRRSDPDAFNLPPEVSPENLPHLTPLRDQLSAPIRLTTFVLFGTVVFVLMIASANIAQLLLARLNERRGELALRAALGASRARITQQLIVEAMALTVTASLAGILVAHWTTTLMISYAPAALGAQTYTVLDWRVLAFAIAIALLSGIVFGVIPAFALSSRRRNHLAIKRLRTSLVGIQAALTLILLCGAYTLGRGFVAMVNEDLGFYTGNTVVLNASLEGTGAANHKAQFFREVVEKLRAIPGVETAGAATHLPLQKYAIYSAGRIVLQSGETSPGIVMMMGVGDGYFSSVRASFVAGRDFAAAERDSAVRAVIVTEQVARETGLGSSIIGHLTKEKSPATIVGVVRDARLFGPGTEPHPVAYFPIEHYATNTVTFTVRVAGDPSTYVSALKEAAASVDPSVPFHDIQLMDDLLIEALAGPRFSTTVMIALGLFALLLAAIGLYGIASNMVVQRMKEIGVRLAIGASVPEIRGLLSRQTLFPLLWGLAAGAAGAFALGRYAQSLVKAAKPPDEWTAIGAGTFLLIVCGLAVWRATSRVARLDPMQALRVD